MLGRGLSGHASLYKPYSISKLGHACRASHVGPRRRELFKRDQAYFISFFKLSYRID